MRWLILGALLGLLLAVPGVPAVAAAMLVALFTQPLFVAFVLGALARPIIVRRWTR
ncbi:hypothetical protein GCM10010330_16280 [Streptomyces tendae]|uniref:hypothetical protein n=1 Tax=Streptomyces tendae TaxID=1932 RepID=UPI001676E4A2|nr:hypothetical protein [Streptomyces tendae]GHA64210.1 hypothetical protein GCM10010330_16280 [Streptomyces tendae]